MSNQILGNGTVMKVDTLDGGAYNTVANQLDCSLTLEMDAVEKTNKGSSQRKGYLAGNTGWSINMTGHVSAEANGDTDGFIVIQSAWSGGALIDFQLSEDGTGDTYTGDILCTSIARTWPQNDTATYSIDGVGDGQLSIV